MHNEQREQFEKWLRTVCFQQPTPEAYDLAWQAWKAAQQKFAPDPPSACEDCGSVDPQVHYSNCPLANTAGR